MADELGHGNIIHIDIVQSEPFQDPLSYLSGQSSFKRKAVKESFVELSVDVFCR